MEAYRCAKMNHLYSQSKRTGARTSGPEGMKTDDPIDRRER